MDRQNRQNLEDWRKRIDELDLKLLGLLNERARHADEIGKLKRDLGIDGYAPEREEEIIRNVLQHNAGPLEPEAVRRLFERIIDESRRLERRAIEKRRQQRDGSKRG